MKLLKISNTDIVKYSQDQFGFKLPSELIPNRTAKFIGLAKLQASDCVYKKALLSQRRPRDAPNMWVP